jgi:hypothetical protein
VGILKGKIAYFSPEQSHGEPLDGRSDQFALAVVLWELLSGHRLFLGNTDIETLRRVRRGTIPSIADQCPELSDDLVGCFFKALHSDPLNRFADGNALAASLERCLAELGGRLEDAELRAVLDPLQEGERKYLPSIPLPFAEEDTSFSTVTATKVESTDARGRRSEAKGETQEDAPTVVSSPGFLADFEDEDTLLGEPSINLAQFSALRDLREDDNSTTLDGFRGNPKPDSLDAESSHWPETAQAQNVEPSILSPEYTDHANMGGAWLSLLLIGIFVLVILAVILI